MLINFTFGEFADRFNFSGHVTRVNLGPNYQARSESLYLWANCGSAPKVLNFVYTVGTSPLTIDMKKHYSNHTLCFPNITVKDYYPINNTLTGLFTLDLN